MSRDIDAIPPFNLGFPSNTAQSSYYPGDTISESNANTVSKILKQNTIFPKNTRLQKTKDGFNVLIASVESGIAAQFPLASGQEGHVRLIKGDHSSNLQRICAKLKKASKYAANKLQRNVISAYIKSFKTGSLNTYRKSQRL